MPIVRIDVPEPLIVERTSYYVVEGATESELVRAMNTGGPTDGENTFWAKTHAGIAWSFDTMSRGSRCELSEAKVLLGINIVYPSWTPPASAQPTVVTKWNTMMASLIKHEHEHVQFGQQAAQGLVRLMREHPIDHSCSALDGYLKSKGQKILDQQSADDRELDIRTNHGASEGVAISW